MTCFRLSVESGTKKVLFGMLIINGPSPNGPPLINL
jgi:hypothetical protein